MAMTELGVASVSVVILNGVKNPRIFFAGPLAPVPRTGEMRGFFGCASE
jgi:hypothetical protein